MSQGRAAEARLVLARLVSRGKVPLKSVSDEATISVCRAALSPLGLRLERGREVRDPEPGRQWLFVVQSSTFPGVSRQPGPQGESVHKWAPLGLGSHSVQVSRQAEALLSELVRKAPFGVACVDEGSSAAVDLLEAAGYVLVSPGIRLPVSVGKAMMSGEACADLEFKHAVLGRRGVLELEDDLEDAPDCALCKGKISFGVHCVRDGCAANYHPDCLLATLGPGAVREPCCDACGERFPEGGADLLRALS